jgi:hypothetical protein
MVRWGSDGTVSTVDDARVVDGGGGGGREVNTEEEDMTSTMKLTEEDDAAGHTLPKGSFVYSTSHYS